MKDIDIDIFKSLGVSNDHRWDRDPNAPLLNILFISGTFGNFLRFFLDKFSQLTPDIDVDPFTEIGTSHNKIKYSYQIQRYHSSFINDNKEESNLNICQILPNNDEDYLYIKIAQSFRSSHQKIPPDYLWFKRIKELKDSMLNPYVENILKLYNLKEDINQIPKFIVRDWYKLEFLQDQKTHYNYLLFKKFKEHEFFSKQKTQHFALESFFNFDTFIKNIKILDSKFNLQLDFNRMTEMKELFDKGYKLDVYRQKVNHVKKIIESISTKENIDIEELDVSMEGFIYAHLEKKYTNIPMPLINDFFKSTKDIKEYIEFFPIWYKRKNPNL